MRYVIMRNGPAPPSPRYHVSNPNAVAALIEQAASGVK
jgi:hypothetical protein